MTEVRKKADFYLLATADPAGLYHFACRLTEKANSLANQIYFLCRDEEQQSRLDDLLYSYRPESFLPHSTKDQPNGLTPIILGLTLPVEFQPDVLINLQTEPALQLPSQLTASEFRVIELVLNTSSEKHIARIKFKGYKEASFELQTHNLDTT